MEVYEKINLLLKEQNITKKEFSVRLRNLEPRLKSTGEAPSEKTIYGYLSGYTSIGIELIPYIADALGIEEQSLFTNIKDNRERFFKNFIKTATDNEIDIIKNKFNLKNKSINYVSEPKSEYSSKKENTQNKLISLVPYAPEPLQIKLINKLQNIKKFTSMI